MEWMIRNLAFSDQIEVETIEMSKLLHDGFEWDQIMYDEERDIVLGVGAIG